MEVGGLEWLQEPFQPRSSGSSGRSRKVTSCDSFWVAPPRKPEAELAFDPLPDYDSTPKMVRISIFEGGKRPPRSSFYTWTVPPELPSGEAAPPNRVDHEEKQMTILRFMNKIQEHPDLLSKKVKQKRKVIDSTVASLRSLTSQHAVRVQQVERMEEMQREKLREAEERLRICCETRHEESHVALHRYRHDELQAEGLQRELEMLKAKGEPVPELSEPVAALRVRKEAGKSSCPVDTAFDATSLPSNTGTVTEGSPRSSDCRDRFPAWRACGALVPNRLEDKEIQHFASKVSILKEGVSVRVTTQPRQHFQVKTLVLSADLRRLELHSGKVRVADSFLRLDALSHLHVPKAASVAKSRKSLALSLVVSNSSPWQLIAQDEQSFQEIVTAVKTLLTFRSKLPEFALWIT
eukprot:symbB.v1.2.005104.t1/scaffold294.1/size237520/2